MSEQGPAIRITDTNGETYEATPENSSLFLFLGNLASRNHIFMQSESEGHAIGMYIFAYQPNFEDMKNFMSQNGYPMHVNLREVADCDERAYQQSIEERVAEGTADIDDEIDRLLDADEQ